MHVVVNDLIANNIVGWKIRKNKVGGKRKKIKEFDKCI